MRLRLLRFNIADLIIFTSILSFGDKPVPDCVLCCSGVTEVMVVESRSYMRKLVEQANLHFMVTGKVKETGQIVSAMKVVTLHNPQLSVTVWNYPPIHLLCYTDRDHRCFSSFGGILQVSGGDQVNEEMMASVEFTNPFTFSLEDVYIRMEGPGVMPPKFKYYR